MKKATLVYPLRINNGLQEVMLAEKMKKIGIGYLFGFGGKIKGDESALACAVRETKEETGGKNDPSKGLVIAEEDLEVVGLMDFYNGGKHEGDPRFRVIIYTVRTFSGEFESTDEMKNPAWFNCYDLPDGKIKPGDELFLPYVFKGEYFKGFVHFSEDEKCVHDYLITPCSKDELVI